MKFEIEVPEGLIESGWTPVAFRVPVEGEHYYEEVGNRVSQATGLLDYPYLIVERKRWRAEEGGTYYWVNGKALVESYEEERDGMDNRLFNAHNYFQTRELAQEAADKIQQLLKEINP